MNYLFSFFYVTTCLANSELVDPEIRYKASEAVKHRQRSFEHNGVLHGLYTHGGRWHYSTLNPREALVDSISSSTKVDKVRSRTDSKSRPSEEGSSTEPSTSMFVSSTPRMTGWLDTIALLTMVFSVGNGFLWTHEVPEEAKFDVGKRPTEEACRGVESERCRAGRDTFWSPKLATPALPAENETVASTIPIPADPCHLGKCFNWEEYRKQVIHPFVNQLQQAQAIGRFEDDEEEGSLFSFSNFKDWYEIQASLPDGQTLSAQTAAILSLKLLAACLAQTRIARVEASNRDGITWQTAISVPGCLLLAIYLLVSIHQLKQIWKTRCERNEDLRNNKLINRLFTPTVPQDPEAVGLEVRQIGRARLGR